MTTYDAITDQFTPNLSDHAKHLYAAIFDGCQCVGGAYVAG
jgi:hypothetical protein